MAIAAVQRKGKGAAAAASVSIGSGDGWVTPTAGNLLVASGNSDATVTMTTAGFTAGASVVDGNGTYTWYKLAAGTESTITITPGLAADIVLTVCEYSGVLSVTPDTTNSSTISGAGGTTTTSVSVTTTAAADLLMAFALVHSLNAGNPPQPTSPTWTNSFVNQVSANSGTTAGPTCVTFVAELLPAGAPGAYSTAASWTNSCNDRQEIVLAFKAAATTSAPPPDLIMAPMRQR